MAHINKVDSLHPIRKRAIQCGIISVCHSCKFAQFISMEESEQMEFKGCSVIPLVTAPPKKCSELSIEPNELEEEERKFYEQNGICWN